MLSRLIDALHLRLFTMTLAAGLALALAATAAAEGKKAGIRIAVISDMNSSYGTVGHHEDVERAVGRIVELRPDAVISTGDMIAGQLRDTSKRSRLGPMWQAFHRVVSNPLAEAGIPLAVTPGNHDASAYPAFRDERRRYTDEWLQRESALDFVDESGYPFRYAFSIGDVLFISLDVTVTGAMPAADIGWLEDLLEEHRDGYSHAVVFSHVPVWPVAEEREREATRDGNLHELLSTADIDLYLSGHHHAFYPGVLDGVTYLSQACLGAGPRRLTGSASGRSPRAFTLIDITGDGIRVASLTSTDFRTPEDWDALPRQIATDAGALVRADLADVAVAPMSAATVAE
jgi:hypothetical protein